VRPVGAGVGGKHGPRAAAVCPGDEPLCAGGERQPIFPQTRWIWSAGANVPKATSVAFMAVATWGFDWCSKVRRCCWRLTRLGITRARVRSMTLHPTVHSRVPASQQEALRRGKIMRKARSRKNRHDLLADLEKRYLNSSCL
jgi:hypothetical protein